MADGVGTRPGASRRIWPEVSTIVKAFRRPQGSADGDLGLSGKLSGELLLRRIGQGQAGP